MREIKFRAWDSYNKKMLYRGFLILAHGIVDTYSHCVDTLCCGAQEYGLTRDKSIDRKYVMQYTGLKDKNGKEIYEGDIIQADGMYNDQIIFQDGGFNLKAGDEGLNLWYQLEEYGNFEVIGNIYENPELLEPGKSLTKEAAATSTLKYCSCGLPIHTEHDLCEACREGTK
jgi:uncharacterized phage protein (TIGR01671 family)